MPTNVVIGTSTFQIIFVTAVVTVLQATFNYSLDVVLALILAAGGVIGGQFGVRAGQKFRAEQLRAMGFAAVEKAFRYFLLGAVIVFPVWLVTRLLKSLGRGSSSDLVDPSSRNREA